MVGDNEGSTSKKLKIIFILLLLTASIFMFYLIYGFNLENILQKSTANSPLRIGVQRRKSLIYKYEKYKRKKKKTFMGKKIIRKAFHTINFTWLANNPIYRNFEIKEAKKKKRVTVLVIVSSGPRRIDRRNAIRNTWWKLCKQNGMVTPECIFMTDYQQKRDKYYEITQLEAKKYGDIYFQNVPGGITFGIRLLNHMVFAVNKYEFDYFLRVDDDYFMCFKNFLNEIPLPPLPRFHWGWVHQGNEDIVRPEESMLMLSRDLIEEFLLQDPYTLMCHPWGDQMIGVWSNSLDLNRVWRHDDRLWHHPPTRDVQWLLEMDDVCHEYIALHGAYPKHMKMFWKHRGKYRNHGGNLMTHSKLCPLTREFQWDQFGYLWRYKPQLCITSPLWDTSKQGVKDGSYTGRGDRKEYEKELEDSLDVGDMVYNPQ